MFPFNRRHTEALERLAKAKERLANAEEIIAKNIGAILRDDENDETPPPLPKKPSTARKPQPPKP